MRRLTPSADDWRRQGQERFLKGRHWSFRQYAPCTEAWDHDHCEYCWAKLSLADGDLHKGYVTTDNCHWICEPCFADFRSEMEWVVEM